MERLPTAPLLPSHWLPEGNFSWWPVPHHWPKRLLCLFPFCSPFEAPLSIEIVLGWLRCLCFTFCATGDGQTQTHLDWPRFLLVDINSEFVQSLSLAPTPLSLYLSHTQHHHHTASYIIITITSFILLYTQSNHFVGRKRQLAMWEVIGPNKQTDKQNMMRKQPGVSSWTSTYQPRDLGSLLRSLSLRL